MHYLAFLALFAFAAQADEFSLPVTADVGICAHPSEMHLNTGARPRIRIKGNEHYYLFTFDPGPIRDWEITGATLYLMPAGGNLRQVAFCSVPIEWIEGEGQNEPRKGASCYTHVSYPDKTWTSDGATLLDATFNSPHMKWHQSTVPRTDDGWLEMAIDPVLIRAVAVGLSQGILLAEEKGQTRENHDVFTREQANARPKLLVTGRLRGASSENIGKRPAPKTGPCPAANDFKSGAIMVDTALSGVDVIGSEVVLVPRNGDKSASRRLVTLNDSILVFDGLPPNSEWSVRVTTFTGEGRLEFETGKGHGFIRASPALPPVVFRNRPITLAGPVRVRADEGWKIVILPGTDLVRPRQKLDGLTQVRLPILTARNAWLGLQAVLEPPSGAAADGLTARFEFAASEQTRGTFSGRIEIGRVWNVSNKSDSVPEVVVPLGDHEQFGIPWERNEAAGQVNQSFWIDVWIPKNTVSGYYTGRLVIERNNREIVSAAVDVKALDVILPDEFNVVGDMNTYDSPAGAMGADQRDASSFMEMERKYYRLAHAHRCTLSVLPYSQSGNIHWRGAPAVSGQGNSCAVSDWSGWDERYGQLLSGSAFSAEAGYVGPGESTPLHHLYLPFHENWPAELAASFKPWPPPADYQEFLNWSAELPAFAECMSAETAAAWRSVLSDFDRHLKEKGWTKTRHQIYLNNKYYFRDPEQGGRGISLWLLDEPMAPDDFKALAYYGQIVRNLRESGRISDIFDFRLDISRPTHQRTWLDGLVDLNVCADQLYEQRRLIAYRKERLGETYWNYRMPASFGTDNTCWSVWPIRSYCWGAPGTLVWQTIASDGDLENADDTALAYPGRKFGIAGPLASLRLKAWRDGLQDAELLRMLRLKRGWNEIQLRAWLGQASRLAGWEDGFSPAESAAIVGFDGIDAAKLASLRRLLLAELEP